MLKNTPAFCVAALAGMLPMLCASSVHAQLSPLAESTSVRLGEQAPSTAITGTVWLTIANKAALDAAVKAMYTKGSAQYRRFGSVAALNAFAPTAAQMAAVKKQLAAHNLTILQTDAHNFSVRVSGKTSDFEAALHSTVEQYRTVRGAMVTTLAAKPELGGSAAGMVNAVTGINTQVMKPLSVVPFNPATGKQIGLVPVSAVRNPQGAAYASNCLYAPQTVTFTTPGAYIPDAIYYGIQYGAPPTNTQYGTLSPCGYSPANVSKLFGLNTAYKAGYTGKGQTIAIIDAYGSPTIASDVAAFDSIYGLPAVNLSVIQTAPIPTPNSQWGLETTLDVEWAHAVAPNASILLLNTPSAGDNNLENALLTVIENHLADIVSNSYGLGENESDLQGMTTWDEICEFAAFEGIDVNFATGDNGDFYASEKLGMTDVISPADSPFATAVGGVSAAFSPIDGSLVQTGWGNNLTLLATPTGPNVPPTAQGFVFGSGGGVSQVFAKPAYQSTLTGNGRELPDVSALADPFTGVEVVITLTYNGKAGQYFEVVGGTSLATPIFSAEYALLQQASGIALGQAAPLIADESGTSAIADVMAPPERASAVGAVLSASGFNTYSAAQLVEPETASGFLGTLWNAGGGYYYDLSFATDSSLPVTAGWDPVTGWGTLNIPAIFAGAPNAN